MRLLTRIRPRCLVATGLGYLIALVLATTATPAARMIPVGLIVGAGVAVGGCLGTARGVVFTWDQQQTHGAYEGQIPVGDRLAEIWSAVIGVAGVLALL
ncbi:hypothetical protein GCM10009804_69070 [Kribbella hippodromi]|uniref:Uncharacterized protein n=1 Tax=Kribbella hippodromi TaxID=434347 RepID=A0ABP4Q6Y5_9ACTN